MIDRIKSIMEYYHLSSAQFADRIGFQRSALSHVLSGRNNPSLDFVLKVKNAFPEVSLDWLTLGTGNQFDKQNGGKGMRALEVSANQNHETLVDAGVSQDKSLVKENKTEQEESKLLPKKSKDTEYQEFNNEKQIKKIILLYDDGSFSEYIPEK